MVFNFPVGKCVFSIFVSQEICELEDLQAELPTAWEEGCDINVPFRDEHTTVSYSQHVTNSVSLC